VKYVQHDFFYVGLLSTTTSMFLSQKKNTSMSGTILTLACFQGAAGWKARSRMVVPVLTPSYRSITLTGREKCVEQVDVAQVIVV
jgi:hypothetical protein